MIRLNHTLDITGDSDDLNEGVLVIVYDKRNIYSLFVDDILGQQQTVIKGMSNYFGNLPQTKQCIPIVHMRVYIRFNKRLQRTHAFA